MDTINVMEELEFILGDSVMCNCPEVLTVLTKYGIDPEGGFLFIHQLPDEAVADLVEQLF